jgi:hypothetical protein
MEQKATQCTKATHAREDARHPTPESIPLLKKVNRVKKNEKPTLIMIMFRMQNGTGRLF